MHTHKHTHTVDSDTHTDASNNNTQTQKDMQANHTHPLPLSHTHACMYARAHAHTHGSILQSPSLTRLVVQAVDYEADADSRCGKSLRGESKPTIFPGKRYISFVLEANTKKV